MKNNSSRYDPSKIEKKWQKEWEKKKIYKTIEVADKPKFYVLDMFPYPSGEGLHVGHPKGYIATDVVSRMKRMQGFNVLHPMGFDAFGLPAEQYAIKTKTNPAIAVSKNVDRYKKQLEILGFDYDWSREVNTTDPGYYKWTQWTFLKLFEKGLAEERYEPVNWCPVDKTVLSNEDVEDGRCERCGAVVEKRLMKQWVLKITAYADRLLVDLDAKDKDGKPLLDWPESIKEAQRNWIGRSEGAEIDFKLTNKETLSVFTTRPDTLFGVTYVVISPEHPCLKDATGEVKEYIKETSRKSEIERTDTTKEKTGVELKGVKAINPATNQEIPIYVADYVLSDYGTGVVMAVPAHDERDFAFAKKYGLPLKKVIDNSENLYTGEGTLVNSGKFTGMNSEDIKKKITEDVRGRWVTKYKLRDWVFSRQRYWGEPIPVFHDPEGNVVLVSEKDLPVKLPKVKYYEPTDTGESPLANIFKWVNVKKGGQILRRETNTMPQWAGSSWYYLRYMDPKNSKKLVDPEKEKYWNEVDLYVGGAEHATRHLIYARFWHKFLFDIGVVSTIEPFKKLQSVGLIMASDGRKMSKRWGNVVNPDEMVVTFGADAMRLYEMFMGPFDQAISWNTNGIVGTRRFIEKVWKLKEKIGRSEKNNLDLIINQTIKKVSEDISSMKFNTAVSQMMIAANEMDKEESIETKVYESFLKLMAPFTPHVAEELWASLGHKKSIFLEAWPSYDPGKIIADTVTIAIQINGKTREVIVLPKDSSEEEVQNAILSLPAVLKWTDGKKIGRIIWVKNRIINLLVDL